MTRSEQEVTIPSNRKKSKKTAADNTSAEESDISSFSCFCFCLSSLPIISDTELEITKCRVKKVVILHTSTCYPSPFHSFFHLRGRRGSNWPLVAAASAAVSEAALPPKSGADLVGLRSRLAAWHHPRVSSAAERNRCAIRWSSGWTGATWSAARNNCSFPRVANCC